MKMLIVGAGLAGSIAAGAFASEDPTVIEASPRRSSGVAGHKAVMRIRDPRIGDFLGCALEEIEVTKGLCGENGLVRNYSTIQDNNAYSLRAYGQLRPCSIQDLSPVRRWLLPKESIAPNGTSILYRHQLVGLERGIAVIQNLDEGGPVREMEYDYCISTIPLPVLVDKIAGRPFSNFIEANIFTAFPIYVTTIEIKGLQSANHQTLYFPSGLPDTAFGEGRGIYRATLEGPKILVESLGEISPELVPGGHLSRILHAFGLSSIKNLVVVNQFTQPLGKIYCGDDDARRAVILRLTREYNIFSFGRFAIWKPIQADSLLNDIRVIRGIINTSKAIAEYNLNKQ